MTKAELYEFVTGLTGGVEIETTLFDTFLDVAQMNIEGLRPWVYLRAEDLTQSASPSDTFTTPKTLPADFREWYDESPLQLVNAGNNQMYLTEVPFADRFNYKSGGGRFCVDYPNAKFYLLGTITEPATIHQNYIKLPTLVSTSDSSSWVFPTRFHKILGLMVAIMWRKGIDYDVFNQPLADNQEMQVRAIYDIMTRWDSDLQYSMQRGKSFSSTNSIGAGSQSGGQVNY